MKISSRPGQILARHSEHGVKLDQTDLEIIQILSINSRTPLAQIAAALGLSSEVINYRYHKLLENQVITDSFAVLDVKLLGIRRFCIYLQFRAISPNKMEGLIQKITDNPHVNWVIETGGKWELIVMVETIDESIYDAVLQSIIAPIGRFLNDHTVSAVKEFTHLGPRYLMGGRPADYFRKRVRYPYQRELETVKKIPIDLDSRDIRLLQLLHADSRTSLTDLGKQMGLSPDTVDYRIKKLILSGLIKSFIIRLNYHLLKFQYTTIMLKLRGVSLKRRNEFYRFVQDDLRFYCLMEQIGSWDLSLMMFFADAKDLRSFLISIKQNFSDVISSHESVLHFDQYLYSYFCPAVLEELQESINN